MCWLCGQRSFVVYIVVLAVGNRSVAFKSFLV